MLISILIFNFKPAHFSHTCGSFPPTQTHGRDLSQLAIQIFNNLMIPVALAVVLLLFTRRARQQAIERVITLIFQNTPTTLGQQLSGIVAGDERSQVCGATLELPLYLFASFLRNVQA